MVMMLSAWSGVVNAGGHPRLLFGPGDVAGLRRRAACEPGASILAAVRRVRADDEADDEGEKSALYDDRGLNDAILYACTGDAAHARAAQQAALRMTEDRAFWNNPGSKGLTRAAGALRVALSYDLCHDAWPEATRTQVIARLRVAADGLLRSMGREANTRLANNWQAVRYAGAGLAYLATDETGSVRKAAFCYSRLKAHLNANLGDNGWNPEGIGYTQYPWQFTGPFGVAARRAGLGDLRQDVPRAALTFWTTYAGSVAIPNGRGLGLRADLSDDHPVWNGQGTAGLAFWYAPEAQRPALRWMYDYLCGARGDRSWDTDRGGGLYSLLYYPADGAPRNPAEVVGLTYTDRSAGVAIFRNAFRDEHDIVALVNGHSRQPSGCHGGPDTGAIRLIGLGSCWIVGGGRTGDPRGQTALFPGAPRPLRRGEGGGLGKLESVAFTPDGGGTAVVTGSSVGVQNDRRALTVDFSGRGGAPAVLTLVETSDNGRVWRLNTPEFNRVTTNAGGFILTAPNGATLTAAVSEPAAPVFRTGTVERGGGASHTAFPYRGRKYLNNTWIEFDCDRRVHVVLTLQAGS
jgi:hypothetical protein